MTDAACRHLIWTLGLVSLILSLLVGCGGSESEGNATTDRVSQVVLNLRPPETFGLNRFSQDAASAASRQITPIASLQIDVHVPGLAAPITAQVANLQNNVVAVELSVPQGPGRRIDVRAFNNVNSIIYAGTTLVDLMNPVQDVSIDLEPVLSLNPLIQADINAATGAQLTIGTNTGGLSGLTVTIPPGAFGQDTTFTLGTRNNAGFLPQLPPQVISVGPVLGFDAMGEPLIEPASITIPYRTTNVGPRQLELSEQELGGSTFQFFVLTPGSMGWQPSGDAVIDTMAETITVPLATFGSGVIGRVMNTPPIATAPPLVVLEDTVGVSQINVVDPDAAQSHTFAITLAPVHGTADIDAAGVVTYTPMTHVTGSDSLSVTVTDSGEPPQSTTVNLAITITPSNDQAIAENGSLTTLEDTPFSGTLNATDVDGDPLTFRIVAQGALGTVNVDDPSTGAFTYIPNAQINGSDNFAFSAHDGTSDSNIATVQVAITPVNDDPIANPDISATSINIPVVINVLMNDSDLDGGPLNITTVTQGANGAVSTDGQSVVYTPNQSFEGTDAFMYTIGDGLGGSATASVTVNVTSSNTMPNATNDIGVTAEDTALVLMVLANDSDPDGDMLGVSAVTQGANGAVVHDGLTVTYTPNADFSGTDNFAYDVCDDGLPMLCRTASVMMTITAVNDPPIANNGALSTTEDNGVNGTLSATDIDGDGLTFSIVSQGALGTATISNPDSGAFTYTPNPDANGADSFAFLVNDGTVDSGMATIDLTITPVNDPPIALNRTLVSVEILPTPGTLIGMDVDGDPLTFNMVDPPGMGAIATIIDMFQGTYLYDFGTPLPQPNSFTYRVNDGTLDSNIATVTIDPLLAPLDLVYTDRAGGMQDDAGTAIAPFDNGSVAVSGFFDGTIILGKGSTNETQLVSVGKRDIFIAKYLADGSLLWARQAGGVEDDEATGIIARLDDTVIITGHFQLNATFGTDEPNETMLASAGMRDIFVAQYDPNGMLIWATQAGGSGDDYSSDMTPIVGPMDGTVITGVFQNTATFDAGQPGEVMLTSAGMDDLFIAKYNPSGQLDWAKRAGGSGNDEGLAMATAGSNHPVITGTFRNTATFGPSEPNETMLTSNGMGDMFVATYDYMTGALIQVSQAGGSGDDIGTGITTFISGDVVVTGTFENTANFMDGESTNINLVSAGDSDIFLVQYDLDTLISWAVRAGGIGKDEAMGVISLPDGTLAVTGGFETFATFGPMEPNEKILSSSGLSDIFLAHYDPAGMLIGAKDIGGTGDDKAHDITSLINGHPVITGSFEGMVTFGIGESLETILSSEGGKDVFISRFYGIPLPR